MPRFQLLRISPLQFNHPQLGFSVRMYLGITGERWRRAALSRGSAG